VIEYIRVEIEEDGKECLSVVLDQLNANGMDDVNTLYLTILNQTYDARAAVAIPAIPEDHGCILAQQVRCTLRI